MDDKKRRKGSRVERLVASGVITRGPGRITFIQYSAVTAASSFTLYDGADATGRNIGTFRCIVDDSKMSSIPDGLQFDNGLAIVLADANIEPTIGYRSDDI